MTLGKAEVRVDRVEKSLDEPKAKVIIIKARVVDAEARVLAVEEALDEAKNQVLSMKEEERQCKHSPPR